MRIEVFVPPSEEETRNKTRHEERFLEEAWTRDPEAKVRPSKLYAAYTH